MWHLITAVLLGLDRYAKRLARSEWNINANIPGVEWTELENSGLAAGWMKEHPRRVLAIHAASVAAMIPALFIDWSRKSAAQHLGASLMLAGGGSNLLDRILHGSVTDMLRFPKAPGRLKSLVFNIADFMLLLGVILTAIGTLCREKK